MMIFMIVVTLLCAFGIGVMGYVVYLFAKQVFSESRNSTSESELRNPYKRNQWG